MANETPGDDNFGARYRFLTDTPPPTARRTQGAAGGLTLSLAAHVVGLILVTMIVARSPIDPALDGRLPVSTRLVFTAQGPEGGRRRGGGGEEAATPARRTQLVGREAIALPKAASLLPDRVEPETITPPAQTLVIPQPQVNSGLSEIVGAVTELRPLDGLRGPGSGPGADGGHGPGSGRTGGAGLNGGDDIGSGDRPGPPGNGTSWPKLLLEVKPNYTADAMRAHVEGMVELEIVVLPDGSVGRVNILRSLDGTFGLDQEAIKAVRLWRFEPARQLGKAVASRVGVELSFKLR